MARNVTLGDQSYPVPSFTPYKFIEATDLVQQVLAVMPEADQDMATFITGYRDSRRQRFSRAAAQLEFGGTLDQVVKPDDWEASGQVLELTDNPGDVEQWVRVFPKAWKHGRKPLENLLCLMVTPNSALAGDDAEGNDPYAAGGSVHKMRAAVLHDATMGQLMELLKVTYEQVREELGADVIEQVGKLREKARTIQVTDQAAKNDERSSSTSSPPPTKGGAGRKSSTASRTAS